MSVIASSSTAAAQMKGLHLFHHGMSSCSQRVRMVLAEKNLSWTSHVVDLVRDQHLAPDYLAINPKGLIPVLVHDGTVHAESMDIVAYLDEHFRGTALGQSDPQVRASLTACDAIQGDIKTTSFEFLFKPKQKKSKRELSRFERLNESNPELLDFHRRFSSKHGLGDTHIGEAVNMISQALRSLDGKLAEQSWMAGEQFSLADIVWMVNAHRLALMDYPLDELPHYTRWMKTAAGRPSYQTALVAWEPGLLSGFFATYTKFRQWRRTDIRAYL